ncbi:MAG: hypothetical protein ABIK61_04315 [candidate division WOR-3 bacterium]
MEVALIVALRTTYGVALGFVVRADIGATQGIVLRVNKGVILGYVQGATGKAVVRAIQGTIPSFKTGLLRSTQGGRRKRICDLTKLIVSSGKVLCENNIDRNKVQKFESSMFKERKVQK